MCQFLISLQVRSYLYCSYSYLPILVGLMQFIVNFLTTNEVYRKAVKTLRATEYVYFTNCPKEIISNYHDYLPVLVYKHCSNLSHYYTTTDSSLPMKSVKFKFQLFYVKLILMTQKLRTYLSQFQSSALSIRSPFLSCLV